MQTDQLVSQSPDVSSELPVIATEAQGHLLARHAGFAALTLGGAIGVGAGVALLLGSRRGVLAGSRRGGLAGSRRGGLVAGGLSVVAAAAVRWQLQRWFTDEPAYESEQRIGKLEIRRYEPRVEAHVRVATIDFEAALDQGYRKLAAYIGGDNARREDLAMLAPVLMHPRATTHSVAFVMPPGRSVASLPAPSDDAVRLVEQPVRRIAVVGYRGRYSNAKFQQAQAELHELVAGAGLEPAGEPVFAGFDSPTTLPVLRRCEVWIELQ